MITMQSKCHNKWERDIRGAGKQLKVYAISFYPEFKNMTAIYHMMPNLCTINIMQLYKMYIYPYPTEHVKMG